MSEAELDLADAELTAAWRKVRYERCLKLFESPGGALCSGEDTEEAEFLYRLAANDVERKKLRLERQEGRQKGKAVE